MSDKWESKRRWILKRAGYRCENCGTDSQRLHVHHIQPKSEGGEDKIGNLEARCPDCHAEAHNANACILCGGIIHEGGEATLLDTSGGSLLHVCCDCREIIEATGEDSDRCGVCGRISNPSRSRGIYWMDGDGKANPPVYKVCDECRKKLFRNRGVVERYIDEELPDGWVDFKHWENSDAQEGESA